MIEDGEGNAELQRLLIFQNRKKGPFKSRKLSEIVLFASYIATFGNLNSQN